MVQCKPLCQVSYFMKTKWNSIYFLTNLKKAFSLKICLSRLLFFHYSDNKKDYEFGILKSNEKLGNLENLI